MPRRSLLFAPLLALALLGSVAFAQELEKATSFGSASIQLPKGWVVKSSSNTGLAAKAPRADREEGGVDSKSEFTANMSVQVSTRPDEIDVAAQQKALESAFPNYRRVEEPTPVTIGEAKGITFGGTFMGGKVAVRTRVYLLKQEGKLYVIGFSTLASRWSTYESPIEASVKTFSVKKG